jgi:acetylornithine deacetylase
MTASMVINEINAIVELQEILSIPSITGTEDKLAKILAEKLKALGADEVIIQESEDFRANVIATFKGKSSAELFLFAHLDTVNVNGWAEYWSEKNPKDPRVNPYSGADVDGAIWSRGAGDVKGGIATVLLALKTLKENGRQLEKSITIAFVSDEESGEPNMGLSSGVKAALPKILEKSGEPKLAIYLEPTNLNIFIAQMGFQILDVKVTGRTAYFGTPELGIDALRIAHELIAKLWAHSDLLARGRQHPLIGKSNLLITSIKAGGLISVPGSCEFSLIRKVVPGESMDEAGIEIRDILLSHKLGEGAKVEVSFSAARDHEFGGTPIEFETTSELQSFQSLINSHQSGRSNFEGAPYWSEAPLIASALGVECIYWAAGDISNCHTPEERIVKQDYFYAISSLAEYMGIPWR